MCGRADAWNVQDQHRRQPLCVACGTANADNPASAPASEVGAEKIFKSKGEQVYEPENSICSFLRKT
jgi:hypothetical protein